MNRRDAKSIAAVAGLVIVGTGAQADTFYATVASGHPPVMAHVQLIDDYFIPEVDRRLEGTGHNVQWTPAYSGTVAKMGGVLESVRDGIAEMGLVAASFEPANLPLQLVSFYAPFSSGDIVQASQVIDDMNREVAALRDSWSDNGVRYLSQICNENVHIFSKEPIRSIEDLEGVKIGGVGANLNWLRNIATGVTIAGGFGAIYNDVKTGVYDAVIMFPSAANSLRLHEVTPYMLKVDFGTICWGAVVANADFYDTLPDAVRTVFDEVGADYTIRLAERQAELGDAGLKAMVAEGLTVVPFPEEERDRWVQTMPDVAGEWIADLEGQGLAAQEVMSTYMTRIRETGQTPLRGWGE